MANTTNPTQQTALIGVLFVILGFALVHYLLMPRFITARSEFETQDAILKGYQQDIATLQAARTQLSTAKTDLIAAGVDLTKANIVVPPTENVPDLYLQVEDLIQRTRFYALDATYQIGAPSSLTGGVEPADVLIPVTINFVSSYAGVKGFIQEMQVSTRPLSITQIGMNEIVRTTNPQAGATQQKTYPEGSFSVSLTAYARAASLSAAYGGTK